MYARRNGHVNGASTQRLKDIESRTFSGYHGPVLGRGAVRAPHPNRTERAHDLDEHERGITRMALTKTAPPDAGAPDRPTEGGRSWLSSPWVLVASAAFMLLLFGWNFLVHPTISAPTRDPAWYTWRAQLLTAAAPANVVREWGPFGM